jgi:hypothetical protein
MTDEDERRLSLSLMFRDKSAPLPEWVQFALDFELIDDMAKPNVTEQVVFKHLMEGSSPNARSNREGEEGWTPMMYAADRGHGGRVLDVLILQDADPNLKSETGDTALIIALRKGSDYMFGQLMRNFVIEGKLDLNAANEKGETALMLAASHGNSEWVDILLNWKANFLATDKEGRSALDYARDAAAKSAWGAGEIVAKLEKMRQEYFDKLDKEGMPTGQSLSLGKPLSFKKGAPKPGE